MRGSIVFALAAWMFCAQAALAAPTGSNSSSDSSGSSDQSSQSSPEFSSENSPDMDATVPTYPTKRKGRVKSKSKSKSRNAASAPASTASMSDANPSANSVADSIPNMETLADTVSPYSSAAPSTSSSVLAPATSANTSSTSLANQAKAVKPKKFKVEIFNYNAAKGDSLNYSHGTVSSTNYLGLRYLFSDTRSISVRQQFSFDYPRSRDAFKMKTDDLYFNYTDASLAKFLKDGSLTFMGRVYVPVGEDAKNLTKNRGSLVAYFLASKPLSSKVTLDYHFVNSWFNQSQDGYVNTDGGTSANKDFSITQFGALGVQLPKKFSFAQVLGTTNTWYRIPVGMGMKRSHGFLVDSSFTYSGIQNLGLTVGVSQEANVYDPSKSFRLFRDSDMEYYLQLSAAI